ncbi:hypothetical protein C8F01DRAFT_1090082 [Mycena amicta]|nr:hypothetical protein C8F01DRAFT_1090082 [Mycena amicta]
MAGNAFPFGRQIAPPPDNTGGPADGPAPDGSSNAPGDQPGRPGQPSVPQDRAPAGPGGPGGTPPDPQATAQCEGILGEYCAGTVGKPAAIHRILHILTAAQTVGGLSDEAGDAAYKSSVRTLDDHDHHLHDAADHRRNQAPNAPGGIEPGEAAQPMQLPQGRPGRAEEQHLIRGLRMVLSIGNGTGKPAGVPGRTRTRGGCVPIPTGTGTGFTCGFRTYLGSKSRQIQDGVLLSIVIN